MHTIEIHMYMEIQSTMALEITDTCTLIPIWPRPPAKELPILLYTHGIKNPKNSQNKGPSS